MHLLGTLMQCIYVSMAPNPQSIYFNELHIKFKFTDKWNTSRTTTNHLILLRKYTSDVRINFGGPQIYATDGCRPLRRSMTFYQTTREVSSIWGLGVHPLASNFRLSPSDIAQVYPFDRSNL